MKNQGFGFVLGLVIGLLVGGVIVWNVNEIIDSKLNNFTSLVNKITLNQNKIIKAKSEISKEEKDKSDRDLKKKKSRSDTATATRLEEKEVNIKEKEDTLHFDIDTLNTQINTQENILDSALNEDSDEEEIVVKKDELLLSKAVDIRVFKDSVKTLKNDSLLSEMSGISKQKESVKYIIEFWKSPINYKGYKMANRKILLFGLQPETVSLTSIDNKIVLSYNSDYYILENSFDFKPYQKVKSEALLLKLKK